MHTLDDRSFLQVVDATPLVSIDLLLFRKDGAVLLGHRLNRPAKDFWFVPGGRILKGERIVKALSRIVARELGPSVPLDGWRSVGLYEHFYDDNFAGHSGIETHYVVLPHVRTLDFDVALTADDQHYALRWFSVSELQSSHVVHPYTKDYFRT